ncbi:MAG TPA: alpha-amylase family glycosyl hydrolase, partial [Aquaticitalea sp.]|nr:alpha-amylase family glycosyl hydrolase [Aquaticitalea sp.]
NFAQQAKASKENFINWNNEIIYHVMPRSFYDSNGDLHGDLNGFVEKLDYLKELGVTTILFTPLYESGFYHNYFPTDYYAIDPEYGTKEEYLNFVKAVHAKGLKFLMDMETQYAQGEHIWFADSYKNPDSEFSDFIYYTDTLNVYPEQIFMESKSPLFDFKTWPNDRSHHIVILNLNHQRVKDWMTDFYTYWVDPNKDGNFDDGVDGFRIDHIMDDLDYKGIFTNMYQEFWNPIFNACKQVNPNVFILGEQSNWADTGDNMVKESGADAAFNFGLKFALSSEAKESDMYKKTEAVKGVQIDPKVVHKAVEESMKRFSDGLYHVTFIENHDTARYATLVNTNDAQKRLGAVLNLLLPGLPSIYYGQELGVTGKIHEWGSDVNHLPLREAFPWTADYNDEGIALFYKDSGEWWDISFWQTDAIESLALSSQRKHSNSLWNHYRDLISLRKKHGTFRLGNYVPILSDNPNILAFTRSYNDETVVVLTNVTNAPVAVSGFDLTNWNSKSIYGTFKKNDSNELELPAYGFLVLKQN